jgi:carboxyl-terminal processing protease
MKFDTKKISWIGAGALAGVLVTVGVSAVAQRSPRLPFAEVQQITDVFGMVKSYYVEPVEDKKLLGDALNGMLQGLDPHSAYLNAEAYKELTDGIRGEFGGLGIEVGTEDGFVKVISPMDGTPAARAGVRAGDLIIKIEDKSTKGMSLSDAVKLMRGEKNTAINITLGRKGDPLPIPVRLVREIIRVQSVRAKMIEPGIAFVRVTGFNEATTKDLADSLDKLNKEKPLKSIILDLRNNPGGVLEGGIGVSAAFLQGKPLVTSTDGQIREAKRQYYASPEAYTRGGTDSLKNLPAAAKTVPIIALVNQGSASASEIVAGALQDHKRATIMGMQSFGKGSVQTILRLENGTDAIKLTTARYYTPSGRSIQAKGITPDILVDETAEGDPFAEYRTREADLERHLGNDKDKNAEKGAAKVPLSAEEQAKKTNAERIAIEKARNRKPVEPGSADDFQVQQALNQLKGLPVQTAKPKAELAKASVTK